MVTSTQSPAAAEWELLRLCAAPQCDLARIRELVQHATGGPAFLARAREHGVLPLLARALHEAAALADLSPGVRQSLLQSRRAHLLFTLFMSAELFLLSGRFAAEGIESVAVKGPVLAAQAFGDASLRQYSDLDFLVHHRDIPRAARIMQDCGFASEIPFAAAAAGKIPGQFLFLGERTHAVVELHTERTLRYFPRPLPLDSFFARRTSIALDGRGVLALSPEDTLVFLCVHGSKHFWDRLMWIADVAGLLARQPALDWARVFAVARATRTERMLHLGLRLAGDVLAAELPPAVAAEVRADAMAGRLAAEICGHLPCAEQAPRGAPQRARIRMQMCGGALRSTRYLLRLAFTPTEEDWAAPQRKKIAGWLGPLLRPLRLARKYRVLRGPQNTPAPEQDSHAAASPPKTKKARA
ncbi:MAG: nucleotidyltransferase family protein [Acidobacteriia bacterium]|nr:nucleotidyltransferase family protein [Terriglobia bacterium]